jgi:hypothetical protein
MVVTKKNGPVLVKAPYQSMVEHGPDSIACNHDDFVLGQTMIASTRHRNSSSDCPNLTHFEAKTLEGHAWNPFLWFESNTLGRKPVGIACACKGVAILMQTGSVFLCFVQ